MKVNNYLVNIAPLVLSVFFTLVTDIINVQYKKYIIFIILLTVVLLSIIMYIRLINTRIEENKVYLMNESKKRIISAMEYDLKCNYITIDRYNIGSADYQEYLAFCTGNKLHTHDVYDRWKELPILTHEEVNTLKKTKNKNK